MDSGEPDRVVAMHDDFQRMMTKSFTHTIEELTGRNVVAFLSQAHVEPDITMEIFFVDGILEGFGAVRAAGAGAPARALLSSASLGSSKVAWRAPRMGWSRMADVADRPLPGE